MNLSQLRHLIALAEHQSFRKAAEALFLTQPALSRSIQALEEELGVKLIDRIGRKNTLTAFGLQVLASARRVVLETKELRRGLDLLKSGELGSISIGYGSGPAAVLETAFFRHVARHHHKVLVKTARGSTDLLIQSLRMEQLDIVVVDRRALSHTDDLDVEPLAPLRGGFLCRAGHPILSAQPIDLAALQHYANASTPLSPEVGRHLAEALGPEAHPDRLMTMVSQDIHGLLEVVATTDTIFFGILAAAKAQLAAGGLVEIPVQPPVELHGQFALVSLARRTESPAGKLFRAFVRQNFGD
jgi:DNA-binding transcriptional LysR family regulator